MHYRENVKGDSYFIKDGSKLIINTGNTQMMS